MKRIHIILSIGCLLSLAACSDQSEADLSGKADEYVELKAITASIAPRVISNSGLTRGTVFDETEGAFVYTWEEGGEFAVYPQTGDASIMYYTITSDMATDSSALSLPSSLWQYNASINYIAMYPPYSESIFPDTYYNTFAYTMPAQVQLANNDASHITPELDPVISDGESPSKGVLTFSMHHVLMLVKLQLTCTETATFHQLSLTEAEGAGFYYSSGNFYFSNGMDTDGATLSDTLTLTFDGDGVEVPAGDTLTAYMVIPPFVYKQYVMQEVHLNLTAHVTTQDEYTTDTDSYDLGTWTFNSDTVKVCNAELMIQH
ncbi:MAG: hypothetical protein IJP70_08225 [Bacteroidales bacterium]|nr:hypothetical protein [Bacteroidales bacterium]